MVREVNVDACVRTRGAREGQVLLSSVRYIDTLRDSVAHSSAYMNKKGDSITVIRLHINTKCNLNPMREIETR